MTSVLTSYSVSCYTVIQTSVMTFHSAHIDSGLTLMKSGFVLLITAVPNSFQLKRLHYCVTYIHNYSKFSLLTSNSAHISPVSPS